MSEPVTPKAPAQLAPANGSRPVNDTPDLAQLAIALLRTPTALAQLGPEEARCVVDYMRLVAFPAGAIILREGDHARTNYLLLVLSGEVMVDKADTSPTETLSVSVLGPGNVIGEMGLLDGAPRSVTCRAATAIQAAGLSRDALELLIDEQPKVAAKLMVALSQRMAERMRALDDQLGMYGQLAAAMQAEITALKQAKR